MKKVQSAMIAAVVGMTLAALPLTGALAHGHHGKIRCHGVSHGSKNWTYMTRKECAKAKANMKGHHMMKQHNQKNAKTAEQMQEHEQGQGGQQMQQ